MNDKDYTKVAFIGLGILFLWWLYQRRQVATTQLQAPLSSDPEQVAFNNAPSGYPIANVNIDIGNQGLAYLNNQYIPLFGFVGIAQGVAYA
jgi:hypothetical protein